MAENRDKDRDTQSKITKNVISRIDSRQEFSTILQKMTQHLFIIKLGAKWCRPCKTIAPIVDAFFGSSPPTVLCADIDVDESVDVYSFLKSKRMVNGIPAMVCYKKDNMTFIPDDSVTGAEPAALAAFFKRCNNHLNKVIVANNKPTIAEVRT